MAKKYDIVINNGTGSQAILNGTYNVSAVANGYDVTTIDPKQITINPETNNYEFKISANGTLTLHVTEDGTSIGTPIEGATFYRCDSTGTTFGDPILSNEQGNAIFSNVPYSSNDAPTIYYKQTKSDDLHDFDSAIKQISLTTQTYTQEIANTIPATKTVLLKDSNYEGLGIESATITLE